MRSARASAALLVLLAGCAPHAPSAPGTAASPGARPASAAPRPSATPVPIRVVTHGANGQYVDIVEWVRGRKAYTIRALSEEVQRSGTADATGVLEQPHVTFHEKSGVTTIADAPKARVTERDKTVLMTGGVHARTSSGSVLTCDVLTYNAATERFHGEGHVRLTAPNGLELGGEHLDGDVKLQNVRVTGSAA